MTESVEATDVWKRQYVQNDRPYDVTKRKRAISEQKKQKQIGDKNVKPCYYQVYTEANRTQIEITSHLQPK